MSSVPSYTVDRETAATLREWLFENAVEKHGESDISEPLAELAAAIDGALYEEVGDVELGAWAQTVGHRDTSHVNGSPVDESRSDDARHPAEPDPLDTGLNEPDRSTGTRPDSAWHPNHEQSTTNQERSPDSNASRQDVIDIQPRTRRQQHRPSVRYRTAYECSVCGSVRELETSLQVCAFVDECPSCGVAARFTADGIPTPFRKD